MQYFKGIDVYEINNEYRADDVNELWGGKGGACATFSMEQRLWAGEGRIHADPPFGVNTAQLGEDPSELEPTSASVLRCGGRTRNQEAAEQAARASIRIEDECPPHHGDLQAEMEQWLADRL
eukprot:261745-Amphidinium_carterae.1